jgi:hypothetical protein
VTQNKKSKYIVLDSKNSTGKTIAKFSLAGLVRKYVNGLAVYHQARSRSSSEDIIGVMALYPFSIQKDYVSYWSDAGIDNAIPRLPAVGGIGLSYQYTDGLNRCLEKLFEIAAEESQ